MKDRDGKFVGVDDVVEVAVVLTLRRVAIWAIGTLLSHKVDQGNGIETRNREEADLVASMHGRSATEIQMALDSLREKGEKVKANDLRGGDFKKNREEALKENGGKCVYCQENDAKHGDHVKSVKRYSEEVNNGEMTAAEAKQEANSPQNIRGACPHCNLSKGARDLSSEPGPGKWVPSNPTPEIRGKMDSE